MYFSLLVVLLAVTVPDVYSQTDCSKPPPFIKPSECCKSLKCPFLTEEVREKCNIPKMPEGGPPPGMKPPCEAVECVMKSHNLLDSSNKVNQAALQTFAESKLGADWKSAIQTAVQTCASEINSSTDSCEARQFMGCFAPKLLLNCPSALWSGTTECNNLKSFIQTCPPPGSG